MPKKSAELLLELLCGPKVLVADATAEMVRGCEGTICREGVAHRTRVGVPSRTALPNFKSIASPKMVSQPVLSAAFEARLRLPVSQ